MSNEVKNLEINTEKYYVMKLFEYQETRLQLLENSLEDIKKKMQRISNIFPRIVEILPCQIKCDQSKNCSRCSNRSCHEKSKIDPSSNSCNDSLC